MTPRLSVVVPTLNERPNVRPLVERLGKALAGIEWEVVFVDDDSSDGTAQEVIELAKVHAGVRLIERIGRRGLASASLEGALSTTAPLVAVIDGDLQHDEEILPRMLAALEADPQLDLVVGSRFVSGGGLGRWPAWRRLVNRIASAVASLILPVALRDPMSGFFVVRRPLLRRLAPQLSARGYKILLDLVATAGGRIRLLEMPYAFRGRDAGESKLGLRVIVDYLVMLVERLTARLVPIRFVLFVMMGTVGLAFHLGVLLLMHVIAGRDFPQSQFIAAGAAMTVNYFLNNAVTYSDRRKRGAALIGGLLVFYLLCSAGLYINLEVAGSAFDRGMPWWAAGTLGAFVGALWNFAVNTTFNWHADR